MLAMQVMRLELSYHHYRWHIAVFLFLFWEGPHKLRTGVKGENFDHAKVVKKLDFSVEI